MNPKIMYLILLICLETTWVSGQIWTVWKGGTPGKESDWFCDRNWSTSHIPDEFSIVVIPDVSSTSLHYPKIKDGEAMALSLDVKPSSKLIIDKSGRLIVFEHIISNSKNNIANLGTIVLIGEKQYDEITRWIKDEY